MNNLEDNHLSLPYIEARALMITWKSTKEGKINEEKAEFKRQSDVLTAELKALTIDVKTVRLRSEHPHLSLNSTLQSFMMKHNMKETLVIVYYSDHVKQNDDKDCVWLWSVNLFCVSESLLGFWAFFIISFSN